MKILKNMEQMEIKNPIIPQIEDILLIISHIFTKLLSWLLSYCNSLLLKYRSKKTFMQVIIYSRRWESEWLFSYYCGFIAEYIRSSSLHTREKRSFCYIKGTGRLHFLNIRLYSSKVKEHILLKTWSSSLRHVYKSKSGFSFSASSKFRKAR